VRGDLSDEQWAVLEPLLPVAARQGRPAVVSRRLLIDGIRWRVRTGAPWRDLPERFGPWQTVYGLFRRWQRAGVWAAVVTGLQARADAAGRVVWQVNVDSTVCRAHQHAAGARRDGEDQREPPGGRGRDEPADHALGRSRGGLTTKIHLACEQGQKPLAVLLTAGQRGDSPQFVNVLNSIRVPRIGTGRARSRPLRVRGDKAYSSRANRAYLRRRGIKATIAEPADQARNRKKRVVPGAGRRRSTVRITRPGRLWNVASTGSNATVRWRPGMTSSPSGSNQPCTSRSSASGCDRCTGSYRPGRAIL
jgi:transposase